VLDRESFIIRAMTSAAAVGYFACDIFPLLSTTSRVICSRSMAGLFGCERA
jgi:hypothetical protein